MEPTVANQPTSSESNDKTAVYIQQLEKEIDQ